MSRWCNRCKSKLGNGEKLTAVSQAIPVCNRQSRRVLVGGVITGCSDPTTLASPGGSSGRQGFSRPSGLVDSKLDCFLDVGKTIRD